MRDVDRGGLEPLVQLPDLRAHRHAQLRVEVRQRLVEEEDARVAHDRAPHRHALPLAPRELAREPLEQVFEPQDLRRSPDALPDDLRAGLREAQAERHVVEHRHVRVERVVLEHHRDVPLLGRDVVHDPPPDRDLSARDLLEPRDHPEQRGLAAPRGADEHNELAVRDVHVDAVDDGGRAEPLLDPPDLDRRHARAFSVPLPAGRPALDRARTRRGAASVVPLMRTCMTTIRHCRTSPPGRATPMNACDPLRGQHGEHDMEAERPMRVGVIGLGSMGLGVARSLLRAKLEVHGFDVRPELLRVLHDEGGLASATPAELGGRVDALVVLVVNADQTEQVLFGGAAKAAAGELTVMASGDPAAFERARPVLEAIATKVHRLGDRSGQGSKVKMVNQLLAGVHIAAAAEAMALCIQAGADPEVVYEVICGSAGSSWMFQNRVPHILTGDYTPLSAVSIFVKDLGIVLDSARKLGMALPLTSTAHQMFLLAAAEGHGGEDDSAVVKIYPGVPLPGPGPQEG